MKSNTVYVLSREPLVVAGGFSTLETLSATKAAFTFLYHNVGWLRPHSLPRYLRAKKMCGADRRLIVVTNEPSEARWLRLVGIEAYALSHNINVREEFFRPLANCEKTFDAVYSAQLAPFKRLALARGVPRLFVVTYENGKREWDLHAFEPSLSHTSFNKVWIPAEAVRKRNSIASGAARMALRSMPFRSRSSLPRLPNVRTSFTSDDLHAMAPGDRVIPVTGSSGLIGSEVFTFIDSHGWRGHGRERNQHAAAIVCDDFDTNAALIGCLPGDGD